MGVSSMNREITLEKFRYWFISFYLLDKEPNLDNYNTAKTNSERLLYHYDFDNKFSGYTQIAILNNKIENKEFSDIYILTEELIGHNLIIAFGKLSDESTSKYTNNYTSMKDIFDFELQNELIRSIESSEIFGTKIKRIGLIHPALVYMEPLEDNLFSNSNINNLINEISSLIEMIGSHRNLWSIIDDCILTSFPGHIIPWDGIIFINTKKITGSDENIHLPDIFLDILKQLACYHWLDNRKYQLKTSALSKYEFQSLISNTTFKETLELHRQLLLVVGQFIDYRIALMDEILVLRDLNTSFLKFIETAKQFNKVVEPNANKFHGLSMIERFENNISNYLDYIEQYSNRLEMKATILSSYSQDRINTEFSAVNLKLQKILILLTFSLAILTIILAVDSPTIENILFNLFE
jgi:hypothetical protein